MAAKTFVFVCIYAVIVQTAVGQFFGYGYAGFGNRRGYGGLGYRDFGYGGPGYRDIGYGGLGYRDTGYGGLSYRGHGYGGFGYSGLGYNSIGYNGNYAGTCDLIQAGSLAASHGGGFFVVSRSLPPTGLAITSENVYEGTVEICGSIPFLGTAEVVGEFPTAGAGGINYGCGDGAIGIVGEGDLGLTGLGYGDAGCGCGFGY